MLVDPLTDPRWLALVERSEDALIFHHPAWLELLTRAYRYRTAAVCVERDGELVAGLPVTRVESRLTGRRLVALPFSDLCPPLAASSADRAELGMLVEAHRAAEGLGLEVRSPYEELPGGEVAGLFHLHVLDLRDEPRLSSMARRNVNKARRAGVVVERRTDRAALDAFFALHLATRRRQGVPTQPLRFVHGLEALFAAADGFVALATLDGAPAAAAVFAGAGRTLTYKYGASDRALLDARPNNALFAEAIAWAREAGYERLDFGRTDLGHDGLRAFKASWGAEETTLSYTYAGRTPPSPGEGAARRALGAVIRRSPPVLGRTLGAALYRHVG